MTLAWLLMGCPPTADDTSTPTNDTADTAPPTDFGGAEIDGSTDCQGIEGLDGDALLALQTDGHSSILRYVTASAEFIDPTPITVAITWPDNPSFTCFPAWDETPLYVAEPRIGIDGLAMSVTTDDGHFVESLDAQAWLFSVGGVAGQGAVFGTTAYADLEGDWVPVADYGDGTGATLDFQVGLYASPSPNGTVGMGTIPLDRMRAGVFGSRFAVATWPHSE